MLFTKRFWKERPCYTQTLDLIFTLEHAFKFNSPSFHLWLVFEIAELTLWMQPHVMHSELFYTYVMSF